MTSTASQVKNIRHNGNITMEDIYNAARVIRPKSLAQDFSGAHHHIHHDADQCLEMNLTIITNKN